MHQNQILGLLVQL
ncbi:hypothetical protein BpHYR1_014984 [Brachionus plicatilis]|uniref:Uncharacterized protein n=1 Tax=Brachionus plicatilis TaxID=10195 RepID=A0A3M7SW58_BRAPC|nr:hypothetical protein BpHYR1_014984 [Brachionus plicatilis]